MSPEEQEQTTTTTAAAAEQEKKQKEKGKEEWQEFKPQPRTDYFVAFPLKVQLLYARQDVENTQHHTMDEIMTWAKERGVYRNVVNLTGVDSVKPPKMTRRTKKAIRARLTIPMHTFKRENGNVIIPVGGHFGILKQAIHRIGQAMKGNYYRPQQWDLIRPFAVDGTEDYKIPLPKEYQLGVDVKLGKINRSGQDAAFVPFAWEKLVNVIIPVICRVNRLSPLPPEEVVDMLHGLNDIPFGPNKHGYASLIDEEVKAFATFADAAGYLKDYIKDGQTIGNLILELDQRPKEEHEEVERAAAAAAYNKEQYTLKQQQMAVEALTGEESATEEEEEASESSEPQTDEKGKGKEKKSSRRGRPKDSKSR